MKRDENTARDSFIMWTKYLHIIITVALFVLAWILFRYEGEMPYFTRAIRYDMVIVFVYLFFVVFFNRVYNSYLVGQYRVRDLTFTQSLTDLFAAAFMYGAVSIIWWELKNPMPFVYLLVAQVIFNCIWSYFVNRGFLRNFKPLSSLIIYSNDIDLRQTKKLVSKPTDRTYSFDGTYRYTGPDSEDISEIVELIDSYDAVFVSGLTTKTRNAIAKYCLSTKKIGFFIPRIGDVVMSGGRPLRAFASPVVRIERKRPSRDYLFIKRSFDIIASSIVMLVLSPLFLIVALFIKLEDGGPIFYTQKRYTKDEKIFEILKFRSMKVDAEKDGVAVRSTGAKDDRVTKIGRFIRAFRIDEFPQLLNVIKGDMSIVGPRPERLETTDEYIKTIPEFKLRLQVRSGLTGYAQIYGKYNTTPYEKVQFDLMYINEMSVVKDLMLIFATIKILFSKESTEGFDEDEKLL